MTSSGTTSFSLSNASIAVAAFSRIQIRRTELLAEHMQDAYTETNLMQVHFNNLSPNLWKVDLVSTALTQGTASYSVDASTIQILDAYLSVTGNAFGDRLLFPMSRTEYAALSNKTQQGFPSQFWFDRVASPTITMWMVPDASSTYTLNYYRCTQIQDSNLQSGQTPDIVFNRWLDAMVAGLSHRLARIWKPELEAARAADADKAWTVAATQDVENTPLFIAPMTQNYWR